MKDIVVYSSICGKIDDLQTKQNWGKADWVLFTDQKYKGGNWDVRPLQFKAESTRRTARYHKTSPHILFPDYQYSIWIDGTIELLVSPESLVRKYLKYSDIAVLNHPDRNCIYKEAGVCIKMGLDDEKTILKQMDEYKRNNYPDNNGLAETKIVVRKNCSIVNEFNKRWDEKIRTRSLRDQLSFDYCLWEMVIDANRMPNWKISDEIKYHFHLDRRNTK